jgi:hypothetical protein
VFSPSASHRSNSGLFSTVPNGTEDLPRFSHDELLARLGGRRVKTRPTNHLGTSVVYFATDALLFVPWSGNLSGFPIVRHTQHVRTPAGL